MDVRNPRKRRVLREKFKNINDVLSKKTTVQRSERKSLKNGIITSYLIKPRNSKAITVSTFLDNTKQDALSLLSENSNSKKVRFILAYNLIKSRYMGSGDEQKDGWTSSSFSVLTNSTDLNEFYEGVRSHLLTSFAQEKHKGSGWTLNYIKHLELTFVNYLPLNI